MQYNVVVAILVTAILSGCSAGRIGSKRKMSYLQTVKSYVGKPSDEVIIKFGVPHNTATLSDGSRVFEYSESKTKGAYHSTSGRIESNGSYHSDGYTRVKTYSCRTTFVVGADGIVKNADYEGECSRF